MTSSIRRALLSVLKTHRTYGSYDLAWNVKIHGNITDPNEGPHKVKDWNFNEEYNWALENMCRSVTGRDNDWLTVLPTPERFPRRYTKILPTDQCYYPAKLKGWKLVDPFPTKHINATFSIEGRSNGWVVLGGSRGLQDTVESGEISNERCRELLAMIPIWDAAFSNPEKELQYQLNSAHEAQWVEQQKEATEARYWAERDVVTI